MIDANHYPNEYYQCHQCDIKIDAFSVSDFYANQWKCPGCKNDIYIYATLKGENQIIIRKLAKNIIQNDLVHIQGAKFNGQIYRVLGIHTKKNGKIAIGLEKYRQIEVAEKQFLNTVTGTF